MLCTQTMYLTYLNENPLPSAWDQSVIQQKPMYINRNTKCAFLYTILPVVLYCITKISVNDKSKTPSRSRSRTKEIIIYVSLFKKPPDRVSKNSPLLPSVYEIIIYTNFLYDSVQIYLRWFGIFFSILLFDSISWYRPWEPMWFPSFPP